MVDKTGKIGIKYVNFRNLGPKLGKNMKFWAKFGIVKSCGRNLIIPGSFGLN